jgi:hypothetical protein
VNDTGGLADVIDMWEWVAERLPQWALDSVAEMVRLEEQERSEAEDAQQRLAL